jgi:hypothetical protein
LTKHSHQPTFGVNLQQREFGLIWLAESTAGWFFVKEKHCWLAD